MRGTYTATYLERVALAFARRRNVASLDIGRAFDLIVGTSTGGIIGCALAAGVPLDNVVSLYSKHGPAIFPRAMPSGFLSVALDLCRRPAALAAGTEALRKALEAQLGKKTIGELYAERGIALAIPAVEMSQHRSWIFKTPHLPGTNHRDDNYSLVDVCLATSAAPVYRSLAAITHATKTVSKHTTTLAPGQSGSGGFNMFVDGGLWANNPVLVGLVDALDVAKPDQEIQIFCLGTCPTPAGEQIARKDVNRGLGQWKFGSGAASLSIDAQQFAFDHMAKKLVRHLNRKCTVVRFPSETVPAALIPYLDLDETRQEAVQALVNQARTDADMTNSRCAYVATDPDAALICSLFEAAPERNQAG
ncbi:phospholipase, patatin family [Ostertagia ostertagi]